MLDKELLDFFIKNLNAYYPNTKVKIYLYGSRARQDNDSRSDYDIAFDIPNDDHAFLLNIIEDSPTLCQIDAVNINKIAANLLKEVQKEGILLYESK